MLIKRGIKKGIKKFIGIISEITGEILSKGVVWYFFYYSGRDLLPKFVKIYSHTQLYRICTYVSRQNSKSSDIDS